MYYYILFYASHTFFVISFAQHKEYITCLISFSKFPDVLPVFTRASATGNYWSICSGLNILRFEWSETLGLKTLATQSKILVITFPCFGKITLSKALRTFCLPLRSSIAFLRVTAFFSFLTDSFVFVDSFKISISSFNLICSSCASFSDKSLL